MALNDYEHIVAARSVASDLADIKNIVKNGLDSGDVLPLIGEISTITAAVQPVLEGETKTEAEVKFVLVSSLIFAAREARELPAGKLRENILKGVESAQGFLEINIVDEPNV